MARVLRVLAKAAEAMSVAAFAAMFVLFLAGVFARYAFLRPGVLEIQLVSDTLLKGVEGSASVLRDALEKHQADPALYSDFCVCVRAKARMER